MKAPAFWNNPPDRPGWQARLLAPIATLWGVLHRRRQAQVAQDIGVPVIGIGNLTVGGTGKTPAVIACAQVLLQAGHRPFVVSRGYGGSLAGPHLVVESRDSADEVGDEPLLLAAFLPVIVAKDRLAGAAHAVKLGADVILLDDGYQDPRLSRALNILMIDSEVGFGNGRLIPAGPMREPIAGGQARADLCLLVGTGAFPPPAVPPTLRAQLQPLPTGTNWAGMRVLAFAGIGRPEKFFATLRDLGAELADKIALGDHEKLSERVLQRILARAKALNAVAVTTEKDAARMPRSWRGKFLTLPVRLVADDPEALTQALLEALERWKSPPEGAENR